MAKASTDVNRVWRPEALKRYRKYQSEFIKERYIGFAFRLSKEKDKNMIDYLRVQDGITEYLRGLIKEDMRKNSNNKEIIEKINELHKQKK